jgi:hypothetical protein
MEIEIYIDRMTHTYKYEALRNFFNFFGRNSEISEEVSSPSPNRSGKNTN